MKAVGDVMVCCRCVDGVVLSWVLLFVTVLYSDSAFELLRTLVCT